MAKDKNIYQFKITLMGIEPSIWRRILIPKYWDFASLHEAIQDAMGWKQCHSYYFEANNHKKNKKIRIASNLLKEFDPETKVSEKKSGKAILSDYFKKKNDKAYYEYDLGDSWGHLIQLEKTLPEIHQMKYPKCLDGKRACPLENSGGVDRYNWMIKVMKNRKHPEYEETKQWIQETTGKKTFRPEHFNPKLCYKSWKSQSGWFLDPAFV